MKNFLFSAATLAAAFLATASAHAGVQSAGQQEDQDPALTPQALGEALSCRSREALEAFAGALFLGDTSPAWMHEIKDDDKQTQGMLGLYGYTLSRPVLLLEEPVDRVYFLQNWVVTLWPRKKAKAFIAAQKMARAPIKGTEQYYRFIDPDSGPMLGAFEPTGNATAAMLAKAFGGELPDAGPSDSLFVGCNYTPASQVDFLEAARQSDATVRDTAQSLGEALQERKQP
ncbi:MULTISPECIES: hypothetical protein [unclassified Novosphingobium]|uniref:hypothetical protein n=1 Tax=unclassified Novosphingobium TaxID=2644732 RepID=UPI001469EEEF|nr:MULTISPECIES: hypothetical protein [unclassified Novosphingobium]NMN07167.1 hypothetical protein [Novosphingobium sp. SG919]NMN89245.1 hypothetical protein [Novosphingobium sp. SG916]